MYSTQVASFNGNQSIYHFNKTLTAVPIVDKGSRLTFEGKGLSRNPTVIQGSARTPRNDVLSDKSKMSIAFREVYKEYSADMKENQFHSESVARKAEYLANNLQAADRLLFSNDNIRPKSRTKSSLLDSDIHKQPLKSNDESKHKQQNGTVSPNSGKEATNCSNNAQDYNGAHTECNKKGRKSRKRTNSPMKSKKGKHGRLLAMATGVQIEKHGTNYHPSKPSRVASEPPSKVSPAAILSFTVGELDKDLQKQQLSLTSTNKPLHNMHSQSCTSSAKSSHTLLTNESRANDQSNHNHNPLVMNTPANELSAQGTSVVVYKLDLNQRTKSASSVKTQSSSAINTDINKHVDPIMYTELSLNAAPCAVTHIKSSVKPSIKFHKQSLATQVLSNDNHTPHTPSKESVLNSIYGHVYQTADKVAAKAEEMRKVKKIFLSEKQSGTLKESGMEFPCAPPATPTPDVLRNHEYVPSMSDIRSQRAVKGRLQVMEKEAQKKREKQKEANAKLEKQQSKDREKLLKTKQRREIYALNKIMTELENKRFLEFCQAKGLNKV